MDFLNESRKAGLFVNEFNVLEELYAKKLWHQLTLKVLEFVQRPDTRAQGTLLADMYQRFITDFEHRINPLQLVEICLPIVRTAQNPQEAIQFLQKLSEKVKNEQVPNILVRTALGALYLEQKNLDEARKYVEELDAELNTLDGVTPVHARFYEFSSSYYRTLGNHSEYYKNALRYLGCIFLDTLSEQEKHERAFYLSLAAILGDGIYNFGELLMHPILNSLNNSNDKWLVDLLFSFNRGDLANFESLKPLWAQQADLKAAEVKMRQKICLLCLMEMAFTRPANNKQLSFEEVALRTKLPEDEVELLVMRALSLGLVKGSIDQISRRIFISWVQPRVLDLDQIRMMRSRLDAWSIEVNKLVSLMQTNLHEIL